MADDRLTPQQDTLSEAADLFRENEAMFGDVQQDKEKANLYRGLAALATGLAEIQSALKQNERAGT